MADMAGPDPVVQKLLESSGEDESRIVMLVDKVLSILEGSHQAYRMQIPPSLVGIHPANRDGQGVIESEVHSLGAEIVAMGWSKLACKDAVCVEDDSVSTIANFTARITANSERLAHSPAVKFGSLSCGHTNQFLCCVQAEVPCEHESIAVAGRMSPAKVFAGDPGLQEACCKGMDWLVVKSTAAALYPSLPSLIQAARNATQQAQRDESEVQLLLKLHRLSVSLSVDGVVEWAKVTQIVSRSRPRQLDHIADYVAYCQKYGGRELIVGLQQFYSAHMPANRSVPASTFAALANLRLPADNMCPLFVTAVVKAQASCPQTKIVERQCRFITAGDIASISKTRLPDVTIAERLLVACRRLMPVALDLKHKVRLLGKLDCLMVRVVLEKGHSCATLQVSTPAAVADEFVRDMNNCLPAESSVASPWAAEVAATFALQRGSGEEASGKKKVLPNMVQYHGAEAVGAPRLQLLHQGFGVGSSVVHSWTQASGIITEMADDGTVKLDTGTVISYKAFIAGWKITSKLSAEFATAMENPFDDDEARLNLLIECWVVAEI